MGKTTNLFGAATFAPLSTQSSGSGLFGSLSAPKGLGKIPAPATAPKIDELESKVSAPIQSHDAAHEGLPQSQHPASATDPTLQTGQVPLGV